MMLHDKITKSENKNVTKYTSCLWKAIIIKKLLEIINN